MSGDTLTRVAWRDGLVLSPHHLQLRDTLDGARDAARHRLVSPEQTGVLRIQWDAAALLAGLVRLQQLHGVLPDGRAIVWQAGAPGGPADLALAEVGEGSVCLAAGAAEDDTLEVTDGLSEPPSSLTVGTQRATLVCRVGARQEGELELGRLVRVGGRLTVDASFIPPLLCVRAWPPLGARMASLLAAIRTGAPGVREALVLDACLRDAHQPPRRVFDACVGLAIGLGAVGWDTPVPGWDPHAPGEAFDGILGALEAHLGARRRQRPVVLGMARAGPTTLRVGLPGSLPEGTAVHLGLEILDPGSPIPPVGALKLGPAGQLTDLCQRARPGIPLQEAQRTEGCQFEVDTTSPLWRAAQDEGAVALYAPLHAGHPWQLTVTPAYADA